MKLEVHLNGLNQQQEERFEALRHLGIIHPGQMLAEAVKQFLKETENLYVKGRDCPTFNGANSHGPMMSIPIQKAIELGKVQASPAALEHARDSRCELCTKCPFVSLDLK